MLFQSTLPAKGATCFNDIFANAIKLFQSTLPAKGATDFIGNLAEKFTISIHAPRKGSDLETKYVPLKCGVFQSTLPAKGATRADPSNLIPLTISIHAPRKGSDAVSAVKN